MHVLVISKLLTVSGNNSTAQQVRDHLKSHHRVTIIDSMFINTKFISTNHVDLIIGIHLLNSGSKFLELECLENIPKILIVSGTDIFKEIDNPENKIIMDKACGLSERIVCFTPMMAAKFVQEFGYETKVSIISHSVSIPQSLVIPDKQFHLIIVANMRPIKDILFIEPILPKLIEAYPDLKIDFVGDTIDQEYSDQVISVLSKFKNCNLLFALPREITLSLIASSLALINTSVNEGCCLSIMEAMWLKTCVIARENPGNLSLVRHHATGLLFTSPSELLKCIDQVIGDNCLVDKMTGKAEDYVRMLHSPEKEKLSYLNLVKEFEKT